MTPKYIEDALKKSKEELDGLPDMFKKIKRNVDKQIDQLCEEAGILTKIEDLKAALEAKKTQIQTKADYLTGRIKTLEEVHREFFYAPIPEGVTHMHGIELAPLDPETRLMVMGGNLETIKTLGGVLEVPEQKEIFQEVPEPEEEFEWDKKKHWKQRIKEAMIAYETDPDLFEKIYNAETDVMRQNLRQVLNIEEDSFEESDEESYDEYSDGHDY